MRSIYLAIIFLISSSIAYSQTNSFPSSGNAKIFAVGESWAEGLSIVRLSGYSGVRFARTDPAGGNYSGNWAIGYMASGNDFSFSTNYSGTQYDGVLHLSNSTRNVGIGTTTPRGQFDVAGLGDIYLANNTTVGAAQSAFFPGYIYVAPHAGTDWSYFQARRSDNSGSTNFRFRTFNAGSLTEAMSILSNGNVGIGTTSPASKLHISNSNARETLRVYLDGNTTNYMSMWQGTGAAAIDPIGTGVLRLGYDQSTNVIMGITGTGVVSGNVGIGTSSPTAKIHIVSDLNTAGANTATLYAPNVGTQMSHIHWGSTGDWYIRSASTSGKIILQDGGGNVGIGTTNPGSYKLAVEGKIGAREVNVIATNPWPDYVFEKNYKLPSLEEIKNYIDQNQHLPEVPSAKEVEKNGVNLGEMNALLLKKIEELTLYTIEMNKKMDELKNENQQLKNRVEKLEK